MSGDSQDPGRDDREADGVSTLLLPRRLLNAVDQVLAVFIDEALPDWLHRFLERLGVDVAIDLHAIGLELRDHLLGLIDVHLPLHRGGVVGGLLHDLLLLGRQAVEAILVHRQQQRRIGVIGHRQILLHLVEVERHHDTQRVVLGVDYPVSMAV